jgi:hypothetical protein
METILMGMWHVTIQAWDIIFSTSYNVDKFILLLLWRNALIVSGKPFSEV